eukprot:666623-Prorocentrum_minimum.AAC.1
MDHDLPVPGAARIKTPCASWVPCARFGDGFNRIRETEAMSDAFVHSGCCTPDMVRVSIKTSCSSIKSVLPVMASSTDWPLWRRPRTNEMYATMVVAALSSLCTQWFMGFRSIRTGFATSSDTKSRACLLGLSGSIAHASTFASLNAPSYSTRRC